jgi:hypothetical protein
LKDELGRRGLLTVRAGVAGPNARPPLTEAQILAWAGAHHRRKRRWPGQASGPVCGQPGENWRSIQTALVRGARGLPGGSSLADLLRKHRGVRYSHDAPALSIKRILLWADAHHHRAKRWPTSASGPVWGTDGETWSAVAAALELGNRGLPGGSTLARLLVEQRGMRSPRYLTRLTEGQILAWADRHRELTGQWPKAKPVRVLGAPEETWKRINMALQLGLRGLPGGSSLPRLLHEWRNYHSPKLVRLTLRDVRQWADAHYRRAGKWPNRASGPVVDAPGETWNSVEGCLRRGGRGLRAGNSLRKLLATRRRLRRGAR